MYLWIVFVEKETANVRLEIHFYIFSGWLGGGPWFSVLAYFSVVRIPFIVRLSDQWTNTVQRVGKVLSDVHLTLWNWLILDPVFPWTKCKKNEWWYFISVSFSCSWVRRTGLGIFFHLVECFVELNNATTHSYPILAQQCPRLLTNTLSCLY